MELGFSQPKQVDCLDHALTFIGSEVVDLQFGISSSFSILMQSEAFQYLLS